MLNRLPGQIYEQTLIVHRTELIQSSKHTSHCLESSEVNPYFQSNTRAFQSS
jgi:hypothetical protein